MRSIERRHTTIEAKDNNLSTFMCFTRAISGQNFSKNRVNRMFNKLVDKNDYEQKEKRELLKFLYNLTTDSKRT